MRSELLREMVEAPAKEKAEAEAQAQAEADGSRMAHPPRASTRVPRLGFAGLGWIGRMRMESLVRSGAGHVAAVADPKGPARSEAARLVPSAHLAPSFQALLDPALALDGLVIATPSAMHAAQAQAALSSGLAVFCQKPLALNAEDTRQVIGVARAADRLLGVDLSYRHTAAVCALRRLVQGGALGRLYAGRFVFHNAYGPDKPWFYDRSASGGGCVIDLGTHLIDLALWLFGNPRVVRVDSRLFAGGRRLVPVPPAGVEPARAAVEVEDHAIIDLDLEGGASIEIGCSWNLPAGVEAVIEVSIVGDAGGAALHNQDGSFYDFTAESYHGTERRVLCRPPDPWGGRALVEWTRRLAEGYRFDRSIEQLVPVAEVVDAIYRGGLP